MGSRHGGTRTILVRAWLGMSAYPYLRKARLSEGKRTRPIRNELGDLKKARCSERANLDTVYISHSSDY